MLLLSRATVAIGIGLGPGVNALDVLGKEYK